MLAPSQLFVVLILLKVVEAYRAGVIPCLIGPFQPSLFRNSGDLLWLETLGHFSILVLQLEKLLICHIISIGIIWVSIYFALLEGPLKESLFLCQRSIGTKHGVHHDLHHHLPFALFHLLLVQLHRHLHTGHRLEII